MDAVQFSGGPISRQQKLATEATPPFSSSSTTLASATDLTVLHNLSPHIRFESVDTIFTAIENAFLRGVGEDALVVAPTSKKQYDVLCQERDLRGRKVRLFYLGTQTKILIITIPTAAHESMHYLLSSRLTLQMGQMGLDTSWSSTGSATRVGPSSSGGEADGNILPFPARSGPGQWPTIVFESGYSQSEQSLRAKMNWWFRASNHEVKIVVLAKAFPETAEKRLKIEQWQERISEPVRSGATATRLSTTAAGAGLQPTCLQTINITWAGPVPFNEAAHAQIADRNQYNVVRAPLVVEFGLIFLRPAVGPHENDFIFSTEFLQFYAAAVWSSM